MYLLRYPASKSRTIHLNHILELPAFFRLGALLFLASLGNPALLSAADSASEPKSVVLSSLGLNKARQYGFWSLEPGRTFDKNIPTLHGMADSKGISSRGAAEIAFDLHRTGTELTGMVGVDDEVMQTYRGPAEGVVYGDGKLLWRSGPLKVGAVPEKFTLDVRGVSQLELLIETSGDDAYTTHIDWLFTKVFYTGSAPENIDPPALPSERIILTPKSAETPRITGARVFGVRPGSPFLFTITATGRRPMTFSAVDLPTGLNLDSATGQITGQLVDRGEHLVKLGASNGLGRTERTLRIVVGDEIALAPAMGWSSWNAWGANIDQSKVLAAAHALVDSGLSQHGFSYVNIDDTWQGPRGGSFQGLQGNSKFPDLKGMCALIHKLGLKVGIYSTPWTVSYAGYPGSSSDHPDGAWDQKRDADGPRHFGAHSFLKQDAQQWAAWGIDYLKCDWYPPDPAHAQKVATALRESGRDIDFSLSCDADFKFAPGYPGVVNSWRTTTDIQDTWPLLCGIAFSEDRWAPYVGPGHWIDPDMMEIGDVTNGQPEHPSRLTPDEQYLHVSMWCLLSAPLILGCDLSNLDDFTRGLVTNDEVLDIDQDPMGMPGRCLLRQGYLQVWGKKLENGGMALGFFNLGRQELTAKLNLSQLGLKGAQQIRDLWRQKDLGTFDQTFSTSIHPHGVILVRLQSK